MVMSQSMLFLSSGTEVGDAFEITDNPGGVVHVVRMTVTAFKKCFLVNMGTIITNGDTDIETKIIAPCLSGGMDQFFKTFPVRGLFQVQVQCRSPIQILYGFGTM